MPWSETVGTFDRSRSGSLGTIFPTSSKTLLFPAAGSDGANIKIERLHAARYERFIAVVIRS
jgi:hypothetical protein